MTDAIASPVSADMFGPVPVGTIIAWAGNISPAPSLPPRFNPENNGWLVCDGRSLSMEDYPLLADVLGGIYGSSEMTFNLPNLCGYFLRAVDLAQSVDRDPRVTAPGGVPNGAGSTQASAVVTHTHTYSTFPTPVNSGTGSYQGVYQSVSSQQTSPPSVPEGGGVSENETRPVNVAVFYLIKAQ